LAALKKIIKYLFCYARTIDLYKNFNCLYSLRRFYE